jgi:nucleoside-diphosphate-sugar epimerase
MKVLITGHRGFVGRHFWQALHKKSHRLYGVDIKTGHDCRDFFRTDNSRFDLVIHSAAVVGGRRTIENNPLCVAQDLAIDADLFSWAAKTKPRKIIVFSSSAAYPVSLQNRQHRKLKETDLQIYSQSQIGLPDFTYGWSKVTLEVLAKYYADIYQGRVFIFRPFSGYGPDQDDDYPFPSFINRAKNHMNPFIVWGSGRQVRDFIHIDDIVNAVLTALKNDIRGPVNLGWGKPVSFDQLARMVTKKAGYKPIIKHLVNQPSGVSYRVCDNSFLLRFYKPKITLEEGISQALKI